MYQPPVVRAQSVKALAHLALLNGVTATFLEQLELAAE